MNEDKTREVGTRCLLTRRLVENGVRFIQLRVDGWDSHDDIVDGHGKASGKSDKPIAGLIADLKQRGLLDSTLLVWGGEFGRTPGVEKKGGRDHSPGGFTMWMAGGGIQGGQVIGCTDEVGYTAVERVLSPADVHATILHALGIDQYKIITNTADVARLQHLMAARLWRNVCLSKSNELNYLIKLSIASPKASPTSIYVSAF